MFKEKNRIALVTKEEKRLVLKSSIIKKYPDLENILTKDSNAIYKKNIDYLKHVDKDTYDTIIYGFKEIRDSASQEWFQAGYQGEVKAKCELCGNSRLTKIFKIADKINKSTLIVGSECIDKFPKMDRNVFGMDIKQLSRLATTNIKKIEKIKNFYNRYPEGKEIIQSWRDVYNKFDLVIPKELDDDFFKLFNDSIKFYNNYTNGKIEEKDLERFKFFNIDFDYLIKQYDGFREENINNLFCCNKNIKQWLVSNEQGRIISGIALSNGKITKDTAKYIYCDEFINRFKNIIKVQFNKHNIPLLEIDSNNITFNYKYKTYNYINLQLTLKEFAEKFSFLFFGGKVQLEKSYLVNNMKIKNSYFDINEYIDICSNILKKSDFSLEFNEKLDRRKELEIKNKTQKKYVVINVIEFINQNIAILFNDELKSKDILIKSINKIKKWDDIANKEKFKISEREMSSYNNNNNDDD